MYRQSYYGGGGQCGLGFDLDSVTNTASSLVDTGTKAFNAVKGKGGGGGGSSSSSSKPKKSSSKPKKSNPGDNWLNTQSNTTLAIGGLALFALILSLVE